MGTDADLEAYEASQAACKADGTCSSNSVPQASRADARVGNGVDRGQPPMASQPAQAQRQDPPRVERRATPAQPKASDSPRTKSEPKDNRARSASSNGQAARAPPRNIPRVAKQQNPRIEVEDEDEDEEDEEDDGRVPDIDEWMRRRSGEEDDD